MKIELHILQNFAPSNLNRDDTGAPKACELGGFRRARISSQCQKRAVRELFRMDGRIAEEDLAARTKRLIHQVVDLMEEQHGDARPAAAELVSLVLNGVGLGRNKKGDGEDLWKTEYLLFVPRRVVQRMADLVHENREALEERVAEAEEAASKAKGKAKAKKKGAGGLPNEVKKTAEALLADARGAVDLALFGRMIADKPAWNVEASCQVAHAISTNKLHADFDFFTAVDDFKPNDTAGSDMMGSVQFNSSCYYRYAVLDVDALRENLDVADSDELLGKAVDGFARAFVAAIPSGKQNSMAAHNFPSYVLAIGRERGQPLSLTNAFTRPVHVTDGSSDLITQSIERLEEYFGRLAGDVIEPTFAVSWMDRDAQLPDDRAVTAAKRLGDLYEAVGASA